MYIFPKDLSLVSISAVAETDEIELSEINNKGKRVFL